MTVSRAYPHNKAWTSAEAAALTGATYRQIDWWHRTGLLGKDTAHGSGSGRRISAEQMWRIQILRAADQAGVMVSRVARALDIRGYDPDRRDIYLALSDQVGITVTIEPVA